MTVIESLNTFKQLASVRLVSTSNLVGAYLNGPSNKGVGATLTLGLGVLTIDSVLVKLNDYILLPAQTDGSQNGIYQCTILGTTGNGAVLQRRGDFQSLEQIKGGQYLTVTSGTVNAGTVWAVITPLPAAIGYTTTVNANNINFVNITSSVTPVGAALTEVNDTNVTATLGGTPATALLKAVSITFGWAGQLSVGRGGTGAATFNANGVVISNTTTTGPLASLALSNGQIVIGATGAAPAAGTITAGTNISITNAANAITINSTAASGITNIDQTTSAATLVANDRYMTDNGATLVTYTLPATAAIGDTYIIVGGSVGGWKVAQNAGQQIHVGTSATTSGTGGSLASSNQYDCLTLTCIAANTTFVAYGLQGNITIV